MSESTDTNLPRSTMLMYGLPWVGASFVSYLLSLYFFKYSTDILLIAPATIGAIYAGARIWDAVSDPMVGYLSDITNTRLGRRRPWLFASVLPLAIVPVLLWSPPGFLSDQWLVFWLIVWILAYETALTIYLIPGMALGAELTMSHHQRTSVFAYRQVCWSLGFFACVGGLYLLTSTDDKREVALWLSLVGGCAAAVMIAATTARLREHTGHQGRGGNNPFKVVSDVWANPHARLLLIVFTAESLGSATLGVLAPYYMQYVIGSEQAYVALLLCHFVPSLLVVPVAVWLSKRVGKAKLWGAAILISAVSFGAFYFADYGELTYVLIWVTGTGIGTGISMVVGPSVQADVVDYDEMVTGERKEGSYFALWNLLRKAGSGIIGALAGIVLQVVGFVPNVEQTEATREAISLMFGIWPATLTGFAGIIFLIYFRLDQHTHTDIMREIERRRDTA